MNRFFFIALVCLINTNITGQEEHLYISRDYCDPWPSSKNIISTVFKSKIDADINSDGIKDEISIDYNKKTEILNLKIFVSDSLNKPFEEINLELIAENLVDFEGLEFETGEIIKYMCDDYGPNEAMIISKSKYEDVYLNLKVLRKGPKKKYHDEEPFKEITYRYKLESRFGEIFITSYFEEYRSKESYNSEFIRTEFDIIKGICKVEEIVDVDLIYGHHKIVNGTFDNSEYYFWNGYCFNFSKGKKLENQMNLTDGLIFECENCNRAKSIGELNKENHGRYISW